MCGRETFFCFLCVNFPFLMTCYPILMLHVEVVLTSSLEDRSFNMEWIGAINPIMHVSPRFIRLARCPDELDTLQYILAFMIAACFLFSMGNKPQASKQKYLLMTVLLALA